MTLKFAFQMDPMEGLNIAGDSSFALMLSAQARGYQCFHYASEALNYADGRVWAGTQGHGVLLMRGFAQAWSCASGQAYYVKPRGRPDPKNPGLAGNVVRASGAVLEPDDVAEVAVAVIRAETFLILPHPEVLVYLQRKTGDYDRWLAGMRKLQARIVGD